MKGSSGIIIFILSFFVFSAVAHGATLRERFDQGIGTQWDISLANYQKVLRAEIAALKTREQAVEPSSENLRIALTTGTESTNTDSVPVRQTGTVGDTASRLWKEFVLNMVGIARWLLHSILGFYVVLVLAVVLLFKSIVGIIAILTPRKRIF